MSAEIPGGSPFVRGSSPMPLIFGHRGTKVHAPENTMGAFLWAAEVGADGVELDTRLCSSGELVVVHDADLKRVADLAWDIVNTPFSDLTMAELGDGYGIPLLSDVLDEMLSRGLLVHIEVKADGQDLDALIGAVARGLLSRGADQRARLCLSSFSRRVLAGLSRACPTIALAALVQEEPVMGTLWQDGTDAKDAKDAKDAANVRAHTAGVHPWYPLLSRSLIARFHAAGRFVNTWTVNDVEVARQLAADGIDGLITDDVALLRRGM